LNRRESDWRGRRVLVSGASQGLGYRLAEALARQGAELLLVARRPEPLRLAAEQLQAAGAAHVDWVPLDVCQPQQDGPEPLEKLQRWVAAPGGLDLLINAVGRSDRGLLMQLDIDQLRQALETNALAAWQMTRLAVEGLEMAGGCIVNIGSLACKLAPPGMGSYPISKFALAGLSQQLRLELAPRGIHLLLVCPGAIDRPDAGQRYQQLVQQRGLDPKLAQPAAGAGLRRIDPQRLCQQILRAAHRREPELIVPSKVRWLLCLHPLFPRLAERWLKPPRA
jgi:uncharacterized protein